ncbi:MAG: hypothetical protein JXR25_05990 [Pontiellaceae bacterium]|nr:hypothetical protein [Pontiellaceae bacterium]MBN2784359.1 hypothetical protein [Pontiellaceae bacterium]
MKSRRYINYATSRTRLINFLTDNIIFHLLSYALVFYANWHDKFSNTCVIYDR